MISSMSARMMNLKKENYLAVCVYIYIICYLFIFFYTKLKMNVEDHIQWPKMFFCTFLIVPYNFPERHIRRENSGKETLTESPGLRSATACFGWL